MLKRMINIAGKVFQTLADIDGRAITGALVYKNESITFQSTTTNNVIHLFI